MFDNIWVTPGIDLSGEETRQQTGRQVKMRRIWNGVKERHGTGQDGQMDKGLALDGIDGIVVFLLDGDITTSKHGRGIESTGFRVDELFFKFQNSRRRSHGTVGHTKRNSRLLRHFFHDVPITFGRIGSTGSTQLNHIAMSIGNHGHTANDDEDDGHERRFHHFDQHDEKDRQRVRDEKIDQPPRCLSAMKTHKTRHSVHYTDSLGRKRTTTNTADEEPQDFLVHFEIWWANEKSCDEKMRGSDLASVRRPSNLTLAFSKITLRLKLAYLSAQRTIESDSR